jgi:hypothetical protein
LFHLDAQKSNYAQLVGRSSAEMSDELPQSKYFICKYAIELDKVLVLTGSPAYKALGIPINVTMDEWYPINDTYEIPTAGQILGRIARRQGYSGILYTSVRAQTKYNLVVFEENTGELEFRLINVQRFDPKSFV